TLAVALSGRDVIALAPSISAASRKQLGEWIWSQLPAAAKMVVDRNTVTKLARFEFDLPEELPIRSIALLAGDRYLDIDLHTPLRVANGVADGHARVDGLHPNIVQVR